MKQLISFLILGLLCIQATVAVCPFPYSIVNILPVDNHGWFSLSNKQSLERIIKTNRPEIIIEIGSWLGASTIFMANKLKDLNNNGVLYAVDTWAGSIEHLDPSLGVQDKLKNLYQQFLSNIIHHHVTDIVIPLRATSMEAVRSFNLSADLIYIDASHEEEDVYNDIIEWSKKLNPDGILCGDDWRWQSVKNAVIRAAAELNKEISAIGNFWEFTNKKHPKTSWKAF